MKGFLAFASLAVVACIAHQLVTNEFWTKIKAAGLKCADELNFDNELFKKLMKDLIAPKTKNEKCMAACVSKEMGFLHDGKLNFAVLQESNQFKWDDAAKVEKANIITKACFEEVGTQDNDCETAGQMVACLLQKKAQALPAPAFSNV